jgi:amino acid adenylation domain-containing protein
MNKNNESDVFNLSIAKHYQHLFSKTWHPAKFPAMPGYSIDNGISEKTLPPEIFASLIKITNGDLINICAVISVALTRMAHYYMPSDYPLAIGYSLQQSHDAPANNFVLITPLADSQKKVAELIVDQRQKILDVLDQGHARFNAIQAALPTDAAQSLFGLQLDIRANESSTVERHNHALLIDFCLSRNGVIRLVTDARAYPATYRVSLLNNLLALLATIVTNPDRTHLDLTIACEQEQQRVTQFSQGETVSYTATARLEHMLEQWANNAPERLALITGDTRWNYQQLNDKANIIAHNLIRRGVKIGDIIAVMLPRGAAMIASIYGVLKAGATYVPVDPNYPDNRRHYIIEDSQAKFVLVNDGQETLDNTLHIADFSTLEGDTTNPMVSNDANALAYMIYTSGSTGEPKGVMIEHHSVFNRVEWMQNQYPLRAGDVILQKTPISFDVSVWELFWWALSGTAVSLLPPDGEKDPAILLETIVRDGVTHMHFVPSMLDAFLNTIETEESAKHTSSLKIVFTSGEALTLHQSTRFFALISPWNACRLINLYGPTEATVDVTYYACQVNETHASVPIGRPIQNTGILVLDKDNNPVPLGVAGELCISGVNLARGYWHRDELTLKKFCQLPSPFNQRVYRSGDLVRWLQDGEIEYLGRIDHQVKIRGYRIELGEIETTILRHERVRDVRVIALAREDGSQYLAAYLLPTDGYEERELREYLLANLPEFMVPPWFVEMSSFPLTPNGKLDRSQLPNPLKRVGTAERVLPQTESEQSLAAIWCDVLGLESVGIHDNFFSLGGDSITSLSVISRARKSGMEISFQTIFSHPTIAGLIPQIPQINKVGSKAGTEYQPFDLLAGEDSRKLPANIEDAYPLSMLQAGLIFQSELQKGASWYHDIQVYTLAGSFNAHAFTQATTQMLLEHPILRTSYHLQGFSQFVQMVHREMPLPLFIQDWRQMNSHEQAVKFEVFIEEESHHQFSWEQPGLIRIHIIILSDTSFRYVLSFHDSTLDGWSINLFHTKLLRYYHQFNQGEQPSAAFHDDFLRRYVSLEQDARSDEASRRYWQQQLSDYEPMPLPRLRAKNGDIPTIEYHDIAISPALSNGLRALAARLNVPLKNVLMAAHLRVLGFIANSENVITGYEHSGRPEEEGVDQAIGLFLNSIPFRLRLNEGESWATLIQRIHQQEAEFLPHRRYPMADMKQIVNTTETLFESVFNFTHFHMLKELQSLPDMNGLDVRVRAETEFVLRAEFSQNAYTDQVQLSLHYHSNEYDAEHIARMTSYYANALQAMVAEPEQTYLAGILMPMEEVLLLQQVGQGELHSLPEESAIRHILAQTETSANKIALQDEQHTLSYVQFAQQSQALALHLTTRSQRQQVVAVTLARSVEWIVAMTAIMAAGNIYMPIDFDNPDARILELLSEGRVAQVICDVKQSERLSRLIAQSSTPVCLIRYGDYPAISNPAVLPLPEMQELAYILFTSGSTGKPKGAMLEHQGMLNHIQAKTRTLNMQAVDVLAQTAPATFDISVWQALTGLYTQACTVVYSKQQQLDPASFCEQIKQDGVTILEIVPSYFAILLEYLEQAPRDLRPLRVLLLTGETLKHELVMRWFALYPEIELVNAYGPTEASDDITHHVFTSPPGDAIVPIGKPIQNMWIHILNAQGQAVPLGTAGEICVTGIGIGRGYINSPEKTTQAFDFAHPLAAWSTGRLYRTGDTGKWRTDGTLAYLGRKDEQVKIRGMRIETGEIENALQSVPGVLNAVIVLDQRQNRDRLVGFVQGRDDIAAILQQVATLLPAFMLPEQLFHCHQIPLNAAGKVDKNQLRFLISTLSLPATARKQPLENEAEIALAVLWADVLKVSQAEIGRDSDFFALGGNSLLAMSAAIRSGGHFTLADIFARRTLAKLAALQTQPMGNVLHPLTEENQGPVLVCFSYAGGNAVNYQNVADALNRRAAASVYAVEPPGNDPSSNEDVIALTEMVSRSLKELQQRGIARVSVWGHCSGAGAVAEFVRQAPQYKVHVDQLIVSGKLLRPMAVLERQMDETQQMSDTEIMRWLKDVTGLTLDTIGQLEVEHRLATAYRNDAIGSNISLKALWQEKMPGTGSIPLLCLLAADDPLTQDWQDIVENWQQASPQLTVQLLDEGGHYFIKTQARQVVDILIECLPLKEKIGLET